MPRALEEYRRKRDFNATPEPDESSDVAQSADGALQFCIQKHDASHLHYDVRLELDGTLKSWAVPKGPSLNPRDRRLAVEVEDHPLSYASFEGSIPEGHYGAGQVIVWDRGIWTPVGDPHEGYRKGRLKFRLDGEKLSGVWNLVRTGMSGKKAQWFLIKSRDEAARDEGDILAEQPDSVLSDRTLIAKPRGAAAKAAKAAQKSISKPASPRAKPKKRTDLQLEGAREAPIPERLKPQLATLVERAPKGDWRYEIKFDGYRLLARIDKGKVRLFTRNGLDWTHKLPQQAAALERLKLQSAWLDGEMVLLDAQGAPDFQALQNAFDAHRSEAVVFYLFDVPYLNGMDLRQVPLEQRRAALAALMAKNREPLLRYSEDFAEDPEQILASACRMKLEGLIGKRLGSPYVEKRSSQWIKIKCQSRQEFVIVGYSAPKGSRVGFGALLLGLHDPDSGQLRYAGRVGTGFDDAALKRLAAQFRKLHASRPALDNPPTGADARDVRWLRPELVCEVAYAQMTREGIVRHSVFRGLRSDKPAAQVQREEATSATRLDAAPANTESATGSVRITHPKRLIDAASGVTKREVCEYYARVSPWLLPELARRPVALVRAPEGVAGEQFFQKHAGGRSMPHVGQLEVKDEKKPLLVLETPEALVGAAQMGVLEIHPWNATAPRLDRPDRFILDLDPDPALPWKRMIEATELTLTLLDELGLQSFLKTSGGKGMHIVVPIARRHDWEEVKGFAQAIARHMAELMPDRFSAVSGPKNRVGKIFIDYLRNGRGATAVAAYSLRARDGLPVSMPIHREELRELKGAGQWTLRDVLARLDELGDDQPWKEMGKVILQLHNLNT